jgi:single-stranded DNA-binding protein
VTKPGELRYSGAGTAFLRVGLMIQDAKRPEDDPPEFANVTIWGEPAEQLQDALPKGVELYVKGRVKARAWAGQAGQPRASFDVSAWRAEVLGRIGRR